MEVTVTKSRQFYPGKWVFEAKEFGGLECFPPEDFREVIRVGDVLEIKAQSLGSYWYADSIKRVK